MLDTRNLRTVKQFASERPAFPESKVRWLVFNAKQLGLEDAVIRDGRRVLLDAPLFDQLYEAMHVKRVTKEARA